MRDIDVVIAVDDEVLVVRATPPLTQREYSPTPLEEEDPFALPALIAPALLQTTARLKRARGPTLDYKAMREGKQTVLKRSKEA